jgi:hypothetical protein
MGSKRGLALAFLILSSGTATAEAPLSAIDWLTRPAPAPVLKPPASNPERPSEPPVSKSATAPDVTVAPLSGETFNAVGLLAPSVTGLPVSLWQSSKAEDLTRLVAAQKVDTHPSMQSLLYTLLLAEAAAPHDAKLNAEFLQSRVRTLISLGGVEPAQAMLEPVATRAPELFQLWFDATLLTGDEDKACAALNQDTALSQSYAARIYCLARGGDWNTAALTFDSARTLGLLTSSEIALLQHFLDPEEFEGDPLPLAPVRPTPLTFRLYEAVGEPLSTLTLPRAFAVADLRDTSGWKAQIEAAERLARTGALSKNRLLGLYTERRPAASGGVWDRVSAMQRFDAAIAENNLNSIDVTLPQAWASMEAARLEDAFARAYAPKLLEMDITKGPGELAYRVLLLSPQYEEAAVRFGDAFPARSFETALAKGELADSSGHDELEEAIKQGLSETGKVPDDIRALLGDGKLGEAILTTMLRFQTGAAGEPTALQGALAAFRALGLEETARRSALEVQLLRRGI